jgi:hypothetical protein
MANGKALWISFRITEEDLFQYLYRGPQRALIIPRRVFASPGEAEAFLQAAQEWHAAATAQPVR